MRHFIFMLLGQDVFTLKHFCTLLEDWPCIRAGGLCGDGALLSSWDFPFPFFLSSYFLGCVTCDEEVFSPVPEVQVHDASFYCLVKTSWQTAPQQLKCVLGTCDSTLVILSTRSP
jgi:hypothetical protein